MKAIMHWCIIFFPYLTLSLVLSSTGRQHFHLFTLISSVILVNYIGKRTILSWNYIWCCLPPPHTFYMYPYGNENVPVFFLFYLYPLWRQKCTRVLSDILSLSELLSEQKGTRGRRWRKIFSATALLSLSVLLPSSPSPVSHLLLLFPVPLLLPASVPTHTFGSGVFSIIFFISFVTGYDTTSTRNGREPPCLTPVCTGQIKGRAKPNPFFPPFLPPSLPCRLWVKVSYASRNVLWSLWCF